MTCHSSSVLVFRSLLGIVLLVGAASCIRIDGGFNSLHEWLDAVVHDDDQLICAASYESDYFAVVRDAAGIRLEQRIEVGTVNVGPSSYLRSVSFTDAVGNHVGQLGPIRKVSRDTVEAGRYVYEHRSEYFPVDPHDVDVATLGATIRILKGDTAVGVNAGSVLKAEDYDYLLECIPAADSDGDSRGRSNAR